MHKIILDCDPGHDDAIAILLALSSPKEIECLGITVCAGNVPIELTAKNALRVLSLIKKVLEDSSIKKVGQNIKYDSLIFSRHGVRVYGIYYDTMIAAHILNPAARSYKLDTLSIEYLNYNMVPIEDLIGSGKDQITMDRVPLDEVRFYASEDADIALQLAKLFIPRLEENNQMDFFQRIEIPLVNVLTQMEKEGVYVEEKILSKMSIDMGERLDILVGDIYKISGSEFNINSTQQLAVILFDELKLSQIKKRSTAESTRTHFRISKAQ